MSSFTPGPWEWDGDDNDLIIRPRRITEDNEVSVIAVLPLSSYEYLEDWSEYSWSAEGEANARLIAAAPEMLQLLKDASHELLEAYSNNPVINRIDDLLLRIEEGDNADSLRTV